MRLTRLVCYYRYTIPLLFLLLTSCMGQTPPPPDTPKLSSLGTPPQTTNLVNTTRTAHTTIEPTTSTQLNLTLEYPTLTPTNTPVGMPIPVLPMPVYFLRWDEERAISQIYRMERDGKTITPITNEQAGIDDYDVSPDGKLVYVSNNRMILADSDGSNPRLLLEGKPQIKDRMVPFDETYEYTEAIRDVRWSPDGERIAYSQDGVNVLNPVNSKWYKVTPPNGVPSRNQAMNLNFMNEWTPDGEQLVVNQAYIEGGQITIYPSQPSAQPIYQEWVGGSFSFTEDGLLLLGAHSYPENSRGLMKINPGTGEETQLVANTDPQAGYIAYPIQTKDGRIFFFYVTSEVSGTGEMQWQWTLIHADAAQPITQPENFEVVAHPAMQEYLYQALWAPDASLVVLGTQSGIKLLDPRTGAIIPLEVGGYDLQWGINK